MGFEIEESTEIKKLMYLMRYQVVANNDGMPILFGNLNEDEKRNRILKIMGRSDDTRERQNEDIDVTQVASKKVVVPSKGSVKMFTASISGDNTDIDRTNINGYVEAFREATKNYRERTNNILAGLTPKQVIVKPSPVGPLTTSAKTVPDVEHSDITKKSESGSEDNNKETESSSDKNKSRKAFWQGIPHHKIVVARFKNLL